MWNGVPHATLPYIKSGDFTRSDAAGGRGGSVNTDAARESVVVTMVVIDGFFRVGPAVIPVAVVEVDEPHAFGLEPQGSNLVGPAIDHIPERAGQDGMGGVFFGDTLQLRRERLGPPDGVGGEVLDLGQHLASLLKGEDGPVTG